MSCVDQVAGESWLASPLSKRVLRSLRSPLSPRLGDFHETWKWHFHGIFMGDTWYLKDLKRGCNIVRWNNIIFNHLYAIFRYVNLLESTSCHWKRGMLQGYASITVDGYDVSFFTPGLYFARFSTRQIFFSSFWGFYHGVWKDDFRCFFRNL